MYYRTIAVIDIVEKYVAIVDNMLTIDVHGYLPIPNSSFGPRDYAFNTQATREILAHPHVGNTARDRNGTLTPTPS